MSQGELSFILVPRSLSPSPIPSNIEKPNPSSYSPMTFAHLPNAITDYPPHQHQHHFVPPLVSERSWSVVEYEDNNDLYSSNRRRNNRGLVPQLKEEKSWSILATNEAEEGQIRDYVNGIGSHRSNPPPYSYTPSSQQASPAYLSLHSYARHNSSFAPSSDQSPPPYFQRSDTASTAPMPEPDFPPSLSAKAFFEETFKYERRRPEDFVGRPDDSIWTNKKIENEIEGDENCTPTQSQIVGKKSRTWSIAAVIGIPICAAILGYIYLYAKMAKFY
ncbi:3751_t:CDS:2 [Paraglomus occultum]|uniref:3751_t:CDS:1 n=1 Tax=Paraglomus occultum TaxID=144539 RepID=A0A9N9B5W6_9GLOM|nr:3751_t:CDS:2 [Paraglomus occultum]